MQIQHYIPEYPLSGFIRHMVYAEGSLQIPYIKELPTGGINLVIELNEHTQNTIYPGENTESCLKLKHAWISGMHKQAILYKNNQDSTIISIRFTAGGFYSLTNIPITTIKNVGIEAETILGNSFKPFYQQLLNAKLVKEKFEIIENYFLKYAVNESMEQDIVKFVDQNIDKPIDWLKHKTGYSQKHLIHLLKKHTGFSPKYLQRISRFHQVVKEIQRQKEHIDWFSVVERYGYHDQAHLIKDFINFTGIKPTEYVTSQRLLEMNSMVPDMILKLPEKNKGFLNPRLQK